MIFIIGAILALVGLVQFIMFLIKSRRPRTTGRVVEITQEFNEKDTNQIRKFPHAKVQYFYKSVSYEGKVLLGRKKTQIGDDIAICLKENEPEKPMFYSARQEIITAIILLAMGIGIMVGSVAILDAFDAW